MEVRKEMSDEERIREQMKHAGQQEAFIQQEKPLKAGREAKGAE